MRLGLGLALTQPRKPGTGGGDTTPPARSSVAVANASPSQIVITYNETLQGAPATSAFTVSGNTVSSVNVTGTTVLVNVATPFVSTDTPTISYTVGANPVRDLAGNNATAFSNIAVTNNVLPSGGSATTFDPYYDGGFTLSQSRTNVVRPTQTKPTVKSTGPSDVNYVDTQFGTRIYLVTLPSETQADTAVTHLRNDYSKRQMVNCNNTRFIAATSSSWWHLYDYPSFAHRNVTNGVSGRIPLMSGLDCEPTWHPTDPNKIWYTADRGGLLWYEVDVSTGVTTTLFDLTSIRPPGFSTATRFSFGGEGRPSNDGRYWTFMAQNASFAGVGLCTYDRQTHTIISYVATTNLPNWVGTSQLGNYAIIGWHNFSGGSFNSQAVKPTATADGTRAYPIAGLAGTTWTQLDGNGEHGDVGVDAYGNEVWVSAVYTPFDERMAEYDVYMTRIDNGATTIFPDLSAKWSDNTVLETGMHFGCTNFSKPGWACISYDMGGTSISWKRGKVVAVELVTTGSKAYTLFDHQSDGVTYFASPLAAPNRDFTSILFGSDFRNSGTPYNQFLCGLPSWALPVAGTSIPINSVVPTITGTPTQGGNITRTVGTWTGVPTPTVTARWQKSTNSGTTWTDVGSTASPYTIPGGESNGTQFSWYESATNTNGTATARSNVLVVAALAVPANTVAPATVNGTTADLTTTTTGTWTGNPAPTYAYTWQRDISSVWTDSAFTTQSATLTPAGSWRAKVVATNSQGSTTAYSNTIIISAAPSEPVPSNVTTFNQADNTTLETINSAWEGSTRYQVQSSSLQNIDPFGAGSSLAWLTASGGTDQAVQTTVVQPADMTQPDRLLWLHLQASGTQNGYVAEVGETQVRLYRITDTTAINLSTPVAGPIAHGVAVATNNITVKMTKLAGRIRVYINGSSTALIDYTDSTPITGGYVGMQFYPGATSTRIKLSEFRYS